MKSRGYTPTGVTLSKEDIELCQSKGHTVKEIVDTFAKVNNLNINVVYEPRRWGDAEKTVLDNPSPYMLQLFTFDELMMIR